MVEFPQGAKRPVMRSFTVRRFDREGRELDIEIAMHPAGPAVEWARAARPGDVLGVAGPVHIEPWRGPAKRRLIAGDESALPAIATVLERLPGDARGRAFIEVEDDSDHQPLDRPDGIELTWLNREGRRAADGPLLAAVRAWPWPETDPVGVWAAGEASVMGEIRAYLQHERGMDRKAFHAVGYWRDRLSEDQAADVLTSAFEDAAGDDNEVEDLLDAGYV